MAYVPVPKDLSKVKTKVAFNLTKRQIVCFAAALLFGLPLFFLLKDSTGTSLASMAIFIPFITQELFQTGAALYYGLNALSNNMILCDRKQLKNPNGLTVKLSVCHLRAKALTESPSTSTLWTLT